MKNKCIFARDFENKDFINYIINELTNFLDGMITTHFKKLMAVVVCLLAGMTAQAQLTATYEPYAATEWGNEKAVDFKLTDVAQALQTDTTTLVAALNSWTAEGSTDANMFFLTTTEGLSDNYTQGGKGGFWVNAEGLPQAWSDDNSGLRWFNTISWTSAENEDGKFSVMIGQFPGQCAVGDTFKPKFVLKLGDKEATLEITINIIEKPTVDIPQPELAWAKLTIVDEITKDVTQKPRSGYDSDKVEVDLTEALTKLGVSASVVQDELRQLLFAKIAYVTEDAVMGAQMSDSLTNQASANGIGFWLRNFSDAEGTPTSECGRFDYNGDDKFYMEAFAFDAETGILSCNLGQYPNSLKGGDTYYVDIYIVFGDKAVKIRYNLIIPEVKVGTLEDYEKAGENTIRVEMEPAESYDTKNFSIDIETMVNALGCQVGEIDDFYMLDSEIDFATGKNQEGVGYWVSMEGKVINWGTDAMFYITPKADDYSKFGIGQYPGHMNIGDSARATLYFVAGSKYYQLNVDLVIVAPKQGDVVFESVAQRAIEVQQVPVAYTWASRVEIPEAWVEQQLGTSDWVLYALAPLNDDGSEKDGNAKYSKSYSISESPGFWMDGEGHNIGWSGNARVGVSISQPSGHFALMQYENSINLGDVFRFPLFLVNEENGKMVTFNFTYSIVESVVAIEEVGSTDIVLPVSADEYGASTTVDLSDVLTTFNITLDALANGQYLHGITADGTYGSGVSLYDGLAFTDKGVCVQEDPFMFFDAELNEDGKSITVTSYAISEVAEDFSAIGTICFLLDGKRYVINVKFVSEAIFTGITEHHSVPHTSQSAVYDLQGRQVVKTQRGLYIQNGRKYMVK
jgi:hypothetical protein